MPHRAAASSVDVVVDVVDVSVLGHLMETKPPSPFCRASNTREDAVAEDPLAAAGPSCPS